MRRGLVVAAVLSQGTGARLRVSTLPCVNDCSASLANFSVSPPVIPGECVEGACVCAPGFAGIDCSIAENGANAPAANVTAADESIVTCTSEVCSDTCSFGGSCVDDMTCSCNDHWGHGKASAVSSAAAAAARVTGSSGTAATSERGGGDRARIDRKMMTNHDRLVLQRVLRALGFREEIPSGKKDPCTVPWRHFSSTDQSPSRTLANPVLIRCHIDGQVTEMDFSRLKLQGQLLSDIGSLKALRTLSLHNNALTGPIPDSIGSLEQLEFLLLYKNQFTGPLPDRLTECTSLVGLVVYGNMLTGSLPRNIGHLHSKLQILDVSYNFLSGQIPGGIGHLVALTELDLSHNLFSGFIPKSVQTLPGIKHFRFSDNQFANTVENIGNSDVWSDAEHNELAEATYDEWKAGLAFEPAWRRKIKREAKERKERADQVAVKAETKASAIDAKVQKLLPPAFRPPLSGGIGGGALQLPSQVSETATIDGT